MAGVGFGHHKLAAREILAGTRQENRDLQREHMFPVQVLMQAVVVALAVLEDEGRRPRLAGAMASLQKFIKRGGVMNIAAELLIPSIRDGYEIRIERVP